MSIFFTRPSFRFPFFPSVVDLTVLTMRPDCANHATNHSCLIVCHLFLQTSFPFPFPFRAIVFVPSLFFLVSVLDFFSLLYAEAMSVVEFKTQHLKVSE